MKYIVRGLKYSQGDIVVQPVFFRVCKNRQERIDAVDEAFEEDAGRVLIEKVKGAK